MITFIKAKLLLISIGLTWLFFIVVMSPLQLPLTLLRKKRSTRLGKYTYNLWIAQDQLVNVIHLGNPDVTVSSKVGYMSEQGSKTARAMEKVIDWLFYIASGQENHCFVSIERDENHNNLRNK